jgi:hypothetical protein
MRVIDPPGPARAARCDALRQLRLGAITFKAQFVMTGLHLFLPVGAQGKRRVATPHRRGY